MWLRICELREVFFFVFVVPCIVNLFYVSDQRDADSSSLFIVLQNHSTCFGCPLHPSSGVHKTVVTTTGTSHLYRWHRSKIHEEVSIGRAASCPTYRYFFTDFASMSPIYMTCTSGCDYSFMYSWWWVQRTPETCRVILQYNKKTA